MTFSYARRLQWRRLITAASRAAGAAGVLVAAALATAAEEAELGLLLALLSGVLALACRHSLRLAARSRVGAESEAQVRRALERLQRRGWSVRHAVDWPGRGDLDHVVRSPSGMGFVVETKTLRYSRIHVVRTIQMARWLAGKRRQYPHGVMPVVCLTRARWVESRQEDALIVSLDRLLEALGRAAESAPRDAADGAAAMARWRHRRVGRNGQRNPPAQPIRRSSVR